MASTKLEELLSKEMTRRQFLMALGFGFLSIFGLSAIMGALTSSTPEQVMHGYGSRNYGH